MEPGLVDIGGRSLYMECRGSGSTTLIFMQGSDAQRTRMLQVENALLGSGTVRVCDYARAGEGQSDPAPDHQRDPEIVDDLASLLKAAQIEPPYVLVGQSVGGDQAWLFADRYPEGLAGFVMMNAGPFELDWDAMHNVWSQEEIDAERSLSEDNLGSVLQAASPEVGVPYVVLMSTISQCDSPTDICGRFYPFYEAWAKEIAGRTGSGRLVMVDAGHEIYIDELDLVVSEIRTLLSEI